MVPNRNELIRTLTDAGTAHHHYETHFLSGEHDAQWPGWYAAFALGRLGDFATPTDLARWLGEAKGDDWPAAAADLILAKLG